eukprot:s662_g1.t1
MGQDRSYPAHTALTKTHVSEEMPFTKRVALLRLTGRALKQGLEEMLRPPPPTSSFPHVSEGLHIVYSPSAPALSRIQKLEIDGQEVDPDLDHELRQPKAVSEFYILVAGDGVETFHNAPVQHMKDSLIRDHVIAYLQTREALALRLKYEQAVATRNFTGTQLIDRNDELCILWEKANIQDPSEKLLKKGEDAMQRKEEEIRSLKIDLGEVQRQLIVVRGKMPEVESLAESVAQLREKVASVRKHSEEMSRELENPKSSLRKWRKLGGEDLDQETLRERLNDKKEALLEKELILEEVTALSEKLRNQALDGRQGTLELSQKVPDHPDPVCGSVVAAPHRGGVVQGASRPSMTEAAVECRERQLGEELRSILEEAAEGSRRSQTGSEAAMRYYLSVALLLPCALAGTNEVGKKFLEENAKREGVVTLPSGLQYKVLREGHGEKSPLVGTPCECHYAGTTPSLTPDAIDKEKANGRSSIRPTNEVARPLSRRIRSSRAGLKPCSSWWKETSGRCTSLPSLAMATGARAPRSKEAMIMKIKGDSKPAERCDVETLKGCNDKAKSYIEKQNKGTAEKRKAELKRLQGMTGNDMKEDNKNWLMSRIGLLKKLTAKDAGSALKTQHAVLLGPLAREMRRQVQPSEDPDTRSAEVLDDLLDRWELEVEPLLGEAAQQDARLARRARRKAQRGSTREAWQVESQERPAAWFPARHVLEAIETPVRHLGLFFKEEVSAAAAERLATAAPSVIARAVVDWHFRGPLAELDQLEGWWATARVALEGRPALWQRLVEDLPCWLYES